MDLKNAYAQEQVNNFAYHEFINPQFAKVLKAIGFDKSFVRAEGMSLFDVNGDEYLDFLAGYGVFAFGRNHPKIKDIIKEFLDLDTANLVQMEAPILSGMLAKRLVELFGHGLRDMVFFTNSGTEANEGAIKFVRAATAREKILHLTHAFHGLTTGSLSVNGNREFKDGFGELLPADAIDLNDADTLEKKLKTREYAAFIFEPVQGKGIYIPNQEFLTQAFVLCKKYGTLTIADEVQTGLGRTGTWLACEHFDLEPDIVTLSKPLSAGFCPVGAIMYTRAIYKKVFSRLDRCVVHSSTFGQNNLAMVCGLAALKILEEEDLPAQAKAMGRLFLTELNKLKERHDWIKEVRGLGLMIGIEFGKPSGFKKRLAWDMVHRIDKGLFGELIVMPLFAKHRILTQVSGHHQDIVKLIPPLTMTEKHISLFVSALDSVLSECENVSGPIFQMGKNLAKHIVKSA